uniref:Uncharacterized protein n=1 Tax=Picea sitchensis TaxID=3332 RepID=A0A6B9XRI5_PICSI|nr:hypothetical protein Q903MT_gene5800 [Picea sitchensis]
MLQVRGGKSTTPLYIVHRIVHRRCWADDQTASNSVPPDLGKTLEGGAYPKLFVSYTCQYMQKWLQH